MFFKDLVFEPEIFKNRMFRVQFWTIRIFGCIVCSDDRFKILHLFRGILNAVVCAVALISGIIFLVTNVEDTGKSTMTLASLIVYLNILVKIAFFFLNSEVYSETINIINDVTGKMVAMKEDFEENFYQLYISNIKRISIVIGGLLFSSSLSNLFEAVCFVIGNGKMLIEDELTANTTLPLLYVMVPTRVISKNFLLSYLLPWYLEILGSFGFFAWTTFYTNLLKYATFRFDVVNYRLQNLFELATAFILEKNLSENQISAFARISFVECVKEIIQLRKLVGNYERIMKLVVFIESLTSTTFLCMILYQITQIGDSTTILAIAPWSLGQLGILYMYYWNANEINFKSEQVISSLYISKWYELPLSFQKELLLFMRGCVNPLTIKAIFFNIDMPSFVLILKTSYSYFTILTNIANKDGTV